MNAEGEEPWLQVSNRSWKLPTPAVPRITTMQAREMIDGSKNYDPTLDEYGEGVRKLTAAAAIERDGRIR